MKKWLAFVLAVVLLISLSACGSGSADVQEPVSVSPEEETQSASVEEKKAVTIEETVLLDEAGVKITAKSINTDELFGTEIQLLIENNSGKNLTFQTRNASVNGYMVETMMSVDVVDGKKANDSLTFLSADLEACGIETIAEMEFSIHIFTTEEWENYLDTPAIQLKTSAFDGFEYAFDDSGELAYETDGIRIVVRGLVEDSIMGPGIVVYIENNSDIDFTVQTRDVSINGFMADPIFSADVLAGKRAVDTITFLSSDLEENGITSIDSVELSFHIFDMEEWETIVDTEPVTIDF